MNGMHLDRTLKEWFRYIQFKTEKWHFRQGEWHEQKICCVKLQEHLGKAEQSRLQGRLGLYLFVLSSVQKGGLIGLSVTAHRHAIIVCSLSLLNLFCLSPLPTLISCSATQNYLMHLICFFTHMCSFNCVFLGFFVFWFSMYLTGIMHGIFYHNSSILKT